MVGNMRIADHGSKKYSRLSILKLLLFLLGEGEGDVDENDIEIVPFDWYPSTCSTRTS